MELSFLFGIFLEINSYSCLFEICNDLTSKLAPTDS